MRTNVWVGGVVLAVAAVAAGCLDIVGYKERTLDSAGGGGAGGSAGTGGTVTGGTGGAGGAQVCVPGEKQPCYTGAVGTENVGVCKGGTQTCDAEGMGFGECVGEVTPTKEDCSKPGNEACTGALGCSDPIFLSHFGDVGVQEADAVAADLGTGNLYVVGTFQSAMQVGSDPLISQGATDAFVAKLGPSGDPVWAKGLGNGGLQYGRSVGVAPDGSVLSLVTPTGMADFGGGPVSYTAAIVKLDKDGNFAWNVGCSQPQNDGTLTVSDLAVDAQGSVTLVGTVSGTVDCGTGAFSTFLGHKNVLVAQYSSAGVVQWVKKFGGVGADSEGHSVAVDSAGNIFLVGAFYGTINFSQNSMFELKDFGTGGEAFVAKLNSTGGYMWSIPMGDGGPDYQTADSVAVDSLGAPVVGGQFAGTINLFVDSFTATGSNDLFVTKLASGGDYSWGKAFGALSAGAQFWLGSVRVAVSPKDDVFVAGDFADTLDFGGAILSVGGNVMTDSYFAKLTGSGEHVWSKQVGTSNPHQVFDVAGGKGGEMLVVGSFGGSLDIGLGSVSASGADAFVAGFAQ